MEHDLGPAERLGPTSRQHIVRYTQVVQVSGLCPPHTANKIERASAFWSPNLIICYCEHDVWPQGGCPFQRSRQFWSVRLPQTSTLGLAQLIVKWHLRSPTRVWLPSSSLSSHHPNPRLALQQSEAITPSRSSCERTRLLDVHQTLHLVAPYEALTPLTFVSISLVDDILRRHGTLSR